MAEQNVPKNARRSPRVWSNFAYSEFLRIAVEAYAASGKNKKGIHKKIMADLNEIVAAVPNESPFTVEQITAKYDALKKRWSVWRSLCNKTGAGWDNIRGTISGSEQWWVDRAAEFGNPILKYKRQPIDNLTELEQIFGNSIATGTSAFTPGVEDLNTQPRSPRSPPPEDIRHTAFDSTWGAVGFQSGQPSFQQHGGGFQSGQPSFQQHGAGSSSRARPSRRRRNENEEKLDAVVDMIYEKQLRKKSRSDSGSPYSTHDSSSPQSNATSSDLKDAIDRVRTFDDIQLSGAISLLQLADKRDTLQMLADDEAKEWLRYEIEKQNTTIKYQQYMISMPPPSYLPVYPPTYPPAYPPNFPPAHAYPPTYPPPYPPVYPPNFPSDHPPQ